MKYAVGHAVLEFARVAPNVGAWIEIARPAQQRQGSTVAPHVGAWIEIGVVFLVLMPLKVAPHVGAWIEILGEKEGLEIR